MARQGRRVPPRPVGGPHPAILFRNKAAAGGGTTPPTYPVTADLVEGTGVRSFGAVTTQAGDYIVVEGVGSDGVASSIASLTPAATGLTFIKQTDLGSAGHLRVQQWTALDATGGSRTVQVTPGGGGNELITPYYAHLTVVRGSAGPSGTGTNLTGQTVSVTRTGDNSGMFEATGDWSTGAVGTPVWTPGGATIQSQQGASATYVFGRWNDSATAGTASHGVASGVSWTTPSIAVLEMLGTATVSVNNGVNPLVVTGPAWPLTVPETYLSASQPLGNPAVGSPAPLVVGPTFTPAPIPGALLFGPGAPTVVVSATSIPQPLVVGTGFTPAPLIPAQIFSPTAVATTPNAAVVSPPYVPVPVPGAQISSSQPLGNPAVGSPDPLVVSTPWTSKVPGALLFGPGAPTAAVVTGSTPGPLVVTPPNVPVPIPATYLSASQPLGTPAVGTPGPLVVTPPLLPAPILAARISGNPAAPVVVTTFTSGPLVVTPPFTPVPIPETSISASQPLGNPAVGTSSPLVVGPPFTVVPVPGARISSTPVIPTIGTRALVVTSTFIAPVPGAKIFAPSPVPVVVSPFALGVQPMVVTPMFRWTQLTVAVLSNAGHFCVVTRPGTGTTTEPGTGTTVYDRTATTLSTAGVTARPNTGTTEDPC